MVAIVSVLGKQYTVEKGDILDVSRLEGIVGETITLEKTLLLSEKGKTTVGIPFVNGVKVKAKILEQLKGPKVAVRRFKAKVRERKGRGFRSRLTKIEIVSIG